MFWYKYSIFRLFKLASIIFLFGALSVFDVTAQQSNTVFREMYQSEVLNCRLEGDLSSLIEDSHNSDELKAVFSYEKNNTWISREVNLQLRGRFRRLTCDFPPLFLKFRKKELRKDGLAEHNDIKLVTHCLNDPLISRQNILREYLAYRIFNILTPHSYQVQLARIVYLDESGLLSKQRRFALLIEDSDELAERLLSEECDDCLNPDIASMDWHDLALLSLFQYMIGNTDWSVLMNRNVKLFKEKQTGNYFSIPYDFDFSGWVNAPYAIPNSELGLSKLTDRCYIGISLNEELRNEALSKFIEKKDEIYSLVRSFKKLDGKSRKELLEYLDDFYEHLDGIDMKFANRALKW